MSTSTTFLGLVKPAAGEAFSRATYNNNLDDIDDNAIQDNNKAKGLVYMHESSSNSGPHTDGIVSNIASFTFKGGRKYRIVWDASHILGDSTTFFYMNINTCLVTDSPTIITGLTGLGGRTIHRQNTTGHYTGPITAYFNPGSDTTVQVKFRATRVGGAATMTVVGNSGEKAVYAIYDDGDQI